MALIRVSRGIPKYNIQIGPMHETIGHNPSAILSVMDSFVESCAQLPMFQWVPILEIGKSWGYSPFFATKRILDFYCLQLKLPLVYVGCAGGVNRSPMTAFCWLLSLDANTTPEAVAEEFYGRFKLDPLTHYQNNIKNGYIPEDLQEFYKVMRDQPTWSYQGVLQSLNKYEYITYENPQAKYKIV